MIKMTARDLAAIVTVLRENDLAEFTDGENSSYQYMMDELRTIRRGVESLKAKDNGHYTSSDDVQF